MVFADEGLIADLGVGERPDPQDQLPLEGLEEGCVVLDAALAEVLERRLEDLLEFSHEADGALELRLGRVLDKREVVGDHQRVLDEQLARLHVDQVFAAPFLLGEVASGVGVKAEEVLEELELLVLVAAVGLAALLLHVGEGEQVDDGVPVPLLEVLLVLLGDGFHVQQLPPVVCHLPIGQEVEVFGDGEDGGPAQRHEDGVQVEDVLDLAQEGVFEVLVVVEDEIADLADDEGTGVFEDRAARTGLGACGDQEVHVLGCVWQEVEDVNGELSQQFLCWLRDGRLVDATQLDQQLEETVVHEQPQQRNHIRAQQA